MWQPESGWQPLTGGLGPSTVGVWRVDDAVVKRLQAPLPGDPGELSDPAHAAYWRRAIDVAETRLVENTPGLRSPAVLKIEQDPEGATLWQPYVEEADLPGPFLARALGRFAGAEVTAYPWFARNQLGDRLARVARGGGWRTLERTTVADIADRLWTRRETHVSTLAELPLVPQHGDPTSANLRGRSGEDVVALDWSSLGLGPVGGDLGYLCLTEREDFAVLAEAYADGLPPGTATPEQIVIGARINAVYTAVSRAEWALARVADGPGALAGKYRHPAVAPYLRSLQRLFPQIEPLL